MISNKRFGFSTEIPYINPLISIHASTVVRHALRRLWQGSLTVLLPFRYRFSCILTFGQVGLEKACVMKAKLQEYALIAEIVSAAAIVASLIFVGLQIQQNADETALNTRSIQGSVYQSLVEQISSMNLARVESEQFADLWARYQLGEEISSVGEVEQLRAYAALIIRHGDLAFHQYQNQLIDKESMDSILNPILAHISFPIGQSSWENLSPALNKDYVRYVNQSVELIHAAHP